MLRPLLLAVMLCCYGVSPPAQVLAGTEAGGRTPIVTSSIPDQEKSLASGTFTIDLSEVFTDTNGNTLSFSAASNKSDLATTRVEGTILTVTMHALGECRIRATARDSRNGKADDTFTLVIRSNQPPRLTSESVLQNYVLFSDGDPLILNLSDIFQDPDGDNLIFTANSTQSFVASTAIDDNILTASPRSVGETTISLTANDQNGGILQESFSLEVIQSYPATLTSEIEVPFEDFRDQGNYRLIALPGDQSMLLGNIVSGKPGRDWVAYAPDTSNGNQLLPYTVSPAFVLNPGKGLWLLSKEDWLVSETTVPTVPLNKQGSYEIKLRNGWNICSNPLDRDLPWKVIAEMNNVSQGIWRWEHGYKQVDTLFSTTSFPEAFYFNNVEELDVLELPYFFRNVSSTITTFGKTPATDQNYAHVWGAEIFGAELAVTTPGAATSVSISWTNESSEGFDRFDQYAPPAYFSSLSLSLTPTHPDFEHRPLAVESRSVLAGVHQFDLLLSAGPENVVTFSLTDLDPAFAERAVLVNRLDTKSYDLLSASQPVLLETSEVPFTLLIGARAQVEESLASLTPDMYSLKQNYPNPFSPSTTIEYSLPVSQHVSLSVFDLMGRHIITLQQGDMAAGLHQVQWSGIDKYRNRVANGIYFYRLDTASWSGTRKMTLIR